VQTGSDVRHPLQRILVATDRSVTADLAVRWAAELAARYAAELIVLQVVPPPAAGAPDGSPDKAVAEAQLARAGVSLQLLATEVAGERGRAWVVADSDPSSAILQAIDREHIDTVVVGNVGMAGRKHFLLSNIPNRISHNARCNVIIVNTAHLMGLAAPAAAAAGQSGAETPLERRLLGRALRILRVLVRTSVQELRARFGADAEADAALKARARRIRDALQELGPTFAKLGQVLSTRPDLLPPELIEELATLQEKVTPLTEQEVVAAMERELGVPWEDVFASIDPQPIAAGTIGQVHHATLESGDRVVVKIQRPTAERDIALDLGLMERLAAKMAARPQSRRVIDVPLLVRQFSQSLRRELDFTREAANVRRMAGVLEPYPRLAVPKVYADYSTSRLLVMEEIGGVRLNEAPPGEARTEAARQLLESYYKQVFVDGFYHADPHPGNLRWWNDRIYFLDLGMVGEIDANVRELMLLLMLAFAQKDARFLSEVVRLIGAGDGASDIQDVEGFRRELTSLVEKFSALALKDIQLGPLLQEITEIAVRHDVRIPAELALAAKAMSQMQLAAGDLDPTLNPLEVARSFGTRNALRQLGGLLDPQHVFYNLQKGKARVSRILESIESLASAMPGGRLQVQFRGLDHFEQTVRRTGRRLGLGLAAGAAIVATAVVAASPHGTSFVTTAMGTLAVLLGTALVVDIARGR
jgi:predicted unusual protein kinase regulating ubiquinone biosynthesis (AarF/ABC1/UbiB family)/nucleotide-binding universal stress UspA family protein